MMQRLVKMTEEGHNRWRRPGWIKQTKVTLRKENKSYRVVCQGETEDDNCFCRLSQQTSHGGSSQSL
jgi:hypothetical protein